MGIFLALLLATLSRTVRHWCIKHLCLCKGRIKAGACYGACTPTLGFEARKAFILVGTKYRKYTENVVGTERPTTENSLFSIAQ